MKITENRPIIITDPCYISKDEDWDDEDGVFNWETSTISSPFFTDYLWEETGVGDGSWSVYEVDHKLGEGGIMDFLDDYSQALNEEDENKLSIIENQQKLIGTYSVDTGCFGAFYLDEALKYNPNFLTGLSNNCYTIITGFTGRIIKYDSADDGYPHLLGIGNKTFYTI